MMETHFNDHEDVEIRNRMDEFTNELAQMLKDDRIQLEKRAKELEVIALLKSNIFRLSKEVEILRVQNKLNQEAKDLIQIELNQEKNQTKLKEDGIKDVKQKIDDMQKTNEMNQYNAKWSDYVYLATSSNKAVLFDNESLKSVRNQNLLKEENTVQSELFYVVKYLEEYSKKLEAQKEILEKRNMFLEMDNITKDDEIGILQDKNSILQKELDKIKCKFEENTRKYETEISELKNSIDANKKNHVKELEESKSKSCVQFAIQIRSLINERNLLEKNLERVTEENKKFQQNLIQK